MLKWGLVVATGTLISATFFLIVLFQNAEFAGSAHGNVYAFIVGLLFQNTCGFILFFGSPIFIFLYFVIANKVAIQATIHGIWKNKAEDFVTNRVKAIVDGITSRSDWANKISDSTMLRMRLLEANSNDPESSGIKKKVLKYGFKKIKLKDINLKDENVRLSDVVSNRMSAFISEASEPSYLFFWLLLIFQVVLFAISWYYAP